MRRVYQKDFLCTLYALCSSLFLTSLIAAQAAEVTPNENLVADGVPKIPATLAENPLRLGFWLAQPRYRPPV